MSKKICNKCGKVIGYTENCTCSSYFPVSQKKSTNCKDLNNKRWRKKREHILKRDKKLCQRCLHKYGIANYNYLQVHHIKPRSKYRHLMFDDSNLITLCRTCNLQLGVNEELDFEWHPDEEITTEFTL